MPATPRILEKAVSLISGIIKSISLCFLVCLGNTWTQRDYICLFCELLWILESQLLVSNKTQGSVHYTRFMSYFHIVNKDRWKIKPIHLKEMHLCLSVALTAFLAWESFNKKLQRKLKSFLFLSLIEVSLLIAATGAPQHYWLCLQSAGKSLSKMATTGRVKNQRYLQMSSSCHSVALSEMSLSRSLEPLLLGQLERILTFIPTPWYW